MQATKRQGVKTEPKGWIRWAFLILVWLAIMSLIKGQVQTRKGFARLESAVSRLEEVKEENSSLLEKVEVVESKEYKERLLREKLNMQRQGEVIVLLPDSVSEVIRYENTESVISNPQKWLNLLRL